MEVTPSAVMKLVYYTTSVLALLLAILHVNPVSSSPVPSELPTEKSRGETQTSSPPTIEEDRVKDEEHYPSESLQGRPENAPLDKLYSIPLTDEEEEEKSSVLTEPTGDSQDEMPTHYSQSEIVELEPLAIREPPSRELYSSPTEPNNKYLAKLADKPSADEPKWCGCFAWAHGK
ncbi:hypothetical protein PtB15_13B382 [Puccinia triticina]|nr:hypothetical protein PtB15_13B382 [Puccinia triticina]